MRLIYCLMPLLLACGMTNQQAIDELRPEFEPLIPKLASIQKLVDAAPPRSTKLDAFEFNARENRASASFMGYEDLADPVPSKVDTREVYLRPFELYARGEFGDCLRNVLASNVPKQARNGKALLARCRPALSLRYLVVVKTARYVVPRRLADGAFAGGDATLEIAVVDWQRSEVVSKFTVEGIPEEKVSFSVKKSSAEAGFHATMCADAKRKLTAQLVAQGARITW